MDECLHVQLWNGHKRVKEAAAESKRPESQEKLVGMQRISAVCVVCVKERESAKPVVGLLESAAE